MEEIIGHVPKKRIERILKKLIEDWLKNPENKDLSRKGCVLTIAKEKENLMKNVVGEISDYNRSVEFTNFSQEKAIRLEAHPDHVSSYQTADIPEGLYPGAVRAGKFIVSISGFPALVDEAMSLVLAYSCGWLKLSEARKISGLSNNPFFEKMYEASKGYSC